jgi:hypothetical protein
MLKGITWTHYLAAVAALLLLWYTVVAVLYYRKEISDFLKGKYKLPSKTSKAVQETDEEDEQYVDPRAAYDELEAIATDIKTSILEVAGNKASKDELLGQLKERLAFYGGIRRPAFRMAMNNFIMHHAEEICGVAYSEQELDAAWETLPR